MNSKLRLRRLVFGFFFALIAVFGLVGNVMSLTEAAYAVDETNSNEQNTNEENNNQEQNNENTNDEKNEENKEENKEEENKEEEKTTNKNQCKESLGAVGWLVCPTTGVIAKAVDWLYDKIEDILIINPVSMSDSSPIYVIWKYFLGMTNIVFVIFLLVVIYSQLTGLGISNYGIKKTLPKLIVAAVLVNLSFLICSIATDVSNLMGNSLRGVFDSVEEAALTNVNMDDGVVKTMRVSTADMFSKMASGASIATVAGVAAFEVGAIWMLIPTVVGALVAVVIGLVTIALRQAVVTLLVMISPLAIVAYMLPNTDKLFDKWKKLMTTMLVFYPMFSLLYGASSLAGFALIMSAKDGFTILLGTAIQIFPLIFSWKLMKMSGTFLGTINSKLHGLTTKPMGRLERWADSHRRLTKHRNLTMDRPATPSLRLMQFMNKQSHDRLLQTGEYLEFEKRRGMGYHISRKYNGDGTPNQEGVDAYNRQARDMEYRQIVDRHMNNMNKGLGQLEVVKLSGNPILQAQLEKLDVRNMNASDMLKAEAARGERINFENAKGFHERMDNAINAHMDEIHMYKRNRTTGEYELDANGRRILNPEYKSHSMHNNENISDVASRYNSIRNIMEGNVENVHDVAADAAASYASQLKVMSSKKETYAALTPPTRDVVKRVEEYSKKDDAAKFIDDIIPTLRVLNNRGDTDLVREKIEDVLNSSDGVELGTHASQALSSFLMFDMKESDPFLRRYGKYINLETAKAYNKNQRQNLRLSLNEYLTGEYEEWDASDPSTRIVGKSKRSVVQLMEGTPLDKIERTAYASFDDALMNAYTNEDGVLDERGYLERRKAVQKSIGSAFISASKKYPTGSEQMVNAVKFWTGYGSNGVARWEDEKDPLYGSEDARKFYKEQTIDGYVRKLTASEVLGLRSDYRDALSNHLAAEYQECEKDDWGKCDMDEYGDLMKEVADIQTRYGDLNAEEAEQKRAADRKDLKQKMAGAEMRRILRDEGTLGQVYNMRRSSPAAGAKKFVRDWLLLDDEVKLSDEMKRIRRDRGNTNNADSDASSSTDDGATYNESRQKVEDIYDTYKRMSGASVEDFWDEIRESIVASADALGREVDIDEIDRSISQYQDVHELYTDIIERFFGGFGDN